MSYKICFSITCHESAQSLRDIFERINFYAPNSCAVVCCGASSGVPFYLEVESLAKEYKNIFINPSTIDAAWGDGRLVNLIFSNFKWAIDNLEFDYFWLEASNSLIINPNIEQHVSQYDLGARITKVTPELTGWMWTDKLLKDPIIADLVQKLNLPAPGAGQHEGCFAKKEIFKWISDTVSPYLPVEPTDYPREESLMQTCILSIMDSLKTAPPGCNMWTSEEAFKKALSNDIKWMNESNIYSVKPVPRKYNDELRELFRFTLGHIKNGS